MRMGIRHEKKTLTIIKHVGDNIAVNDDFIM